MRFVFKAPALYRMQSVLSSTSSTQPQHNTACSWQHNRFQPQQQSLLQHTSDASPHRAFVSDYQTADRVTTVISASVQHLYTYIHPGSLPTTHVYYGHTCIDALLVLSKLFPDPLPTPSQYTRGTPCLT
mmetsp:Transcript_34780/g.77340  ORF Transcript_34780/g.77340 Transcript_34780/m.77340 type:complete len:129 (-) Transcript_34780:1864-2250(-)